MSGALDRARRFSRSALQSKVHPGYPPACSIPNRSLNKHPTMPQSNIIPIEQGVNLLVALTALEKIDHSCSTLASKLPHGSRSKVSSLGNSLIEIKLCSRFVRDKIAYNVSGGEPEVGETLATLSLLKGSMIGSFGRKGNKPARSSTS